MKLYALVPVKSLFQAKSRLTDYLPLHRRQTLVLEMLQHVLQTLHESSVFAQIYVVSPDPVVLELAQHWSAEPLLETSAGHNPALETAARQILTRVAWREHADISGHTTRWPGLTFRSLNAMKPEAQIGNLITQTQQPGSPDSLLHDGQQHLHAHSDTGLLTISADLPLLTVEDIQALVQAGEHSQVVLAASNDGTGTNALLTRPPLVLPYLFGPDSLPTYVQTAREYNVSYQRLSRPNLAWDIDTPADVQQLEKVGWSHQLV